MVYSHAGKDDGAAGINLLHQRRQAIYVIDYEMLHAVLLLRRSGGTDESDGIHEIADSIVADIAYLFDLYQRGTVKMFDAGSNENLEYGRIVVGFDSVKHAARKSREEFLSRLAIDVRIDAIDGFARLQGSQHCRYIFEISHAKCFMWIVTFIR